MQTMSSSLCSARMVLGVEPSISHCRHLLTSFRYASGLHLLNFRPVPMTFTFSLPITKPYALKTRSAWCQACGNNSTRTCDVLASLNSTTAALHAAQSGHHGRWGGSVSPIGAGFIGMAVTLFVILLLLALAALLGLVSFGRKGRRGSNGVVGGRENKAM